MKEHKSKLTIEHMKHQNRLLNETPSNNTNLLHPAYERVIDIAILPSE